MEGTHHSLLATSCKEIVSSNTKECITDTKLQKFTEIDI